MDWLLRHVVVVLLAVVIGFFVYLFYQVRLSIRTQKKKDSTAEASYDPNYPEPESVQFRAEVVDQSCFVSMKGLKTPKTVKEFFVFFRDDAGELYKLPVPEECYEGFEKGQVGMLTLVDGALYSFIPDEE